MLMAQVIRWQVIFAYQVPGLCRLQRLAGGEYAAALPDHVVLYGTSAHMPDAVAGGSRAQAYAPVIVSILPPVATARPLFTADTFQLVTVAMSHLTAARQTP